MASFKFKVGVSTTRSATKDGVRYNTSFNETELTVAEFAELIGNGHSFSGVYGRRDRVNEEQQKESFTPRYFVAIDADGNSRKLNDKDKFFAHKAYTSLGITPTINYETYSSAKDDVRFRFVWVLSEPITDRDQYITISNKLNGVLMSSIGEEADTCNEDFTITIFNGTDKKVDASERCVFTADYLSKCLDGITLRERSKRTAERSEGISVEGEALNELRRKGFRRFLSENQGLPMIDSNQLYRGIDEEGLYVEMEGGYREFSTPYEIDKDGYRSARLKDGQRRRRKIREWAGTLANWHKKDGTLLGEDYKRQFVFILCNLIWRHIDDTGLTNDDIADSIEKGANEGYDGGRKRKFKLIKSNIMEKKGITTNEQWEKERHSIVPKIGAKIRKAEALSMYDPDKTVKENAAEMGITAKTLRKYLGTEPKEDKAKIDEFIIANKEFGYKTVYRMMVDGDFPYAPKCDRTIYNAYKRLGLNINGEGKTNNAIEAIEHANSEEHEHMERRLDGLTNSRDSINSRVTSNTAKIKNLSDEIDGIKEKIGGFESLLWGKNVCVPRGQ